jgi:RNA polymerase sigma-70 factor (ECF subfamily)
LDNQDIQDVIRECVSGNAEAWVRFVRSFQRLISSTVLKTARRFGQPSPDLLEDLVQDTYVRLCADGFRVLRELREPSAAFGLVQAVAYTTVQDHFRSALAQKRGGGLALVPLDAGGPDHAGHRPPIERAVLISEIHDMLCKVTSSPRDRLMFWLYYRHGFSSQAIAALPSIRISPKAVESALLRLTAGIRRRLIAPGPAKEFVKED